MGDVWGIMNKIVIYIFIIAIVVFIYRIIQRRKEFIIKIAYRSVRVKKGSPPNKFLNECKEVAKIHKTIQGEIFGIREHDRVNLDFSKSIKDSEKQIFRNIWCN